jgi:hypothetical protein
MKCHIDKKYTGILFFSCVTFDSKKSFVVKFEKVRGAIRNANS